MARVQLTRQAIRHFEQLPQHLQEPALNTLTDLEIDPEAAGKTLLGRLRGPCPARVGSYRVIYSIEGSRRSPKVIVRAIQHRSAAYPRGSPG
jgi:mRNA-degrading endonuclease RelE of RelBE toxin-antitoxin system